MSTTPRTDAALKVTIGAGFEAVSPNFARTLETELTRLRALFPAILAALRNGSCCTPDVSIGLLESIPNEVASVVSRLRADFGVLTMQCAAASDRNVNLRLEIDRLRAELAETKEASK